MLANLTQEVNNFFYWTHRAGIFHLQTFKTGLQYSVSNFANAKSLCQKWDRTRNQKRTI